MKINFKELLMVVGCFLFATGITAQSKNFMGFRAGIGYNNLYGENIKNAESLIGFNGGLFFNYSLGEMVGIQPELNLSIRGADKAEINGFPFKKATVSYIQVPVLFHIQPTFQWGDNLSPFLLIGPAINFNFIKDLEGEVLDDIPGAYSVDQDVKSQYYEVLLGAGFEIQSKYLIDLRYSRGISKVFENGDAQSNSVILSIGFIF